MAPRETGAQSGQGVAAANDSARSSPELLLQPGMLSSDFVSAPDGYPSTSGFNLRFATLLPTRWKWLTPIIGASVTPYGTTGTSPRNENAPLLFVGNVFPAVNRRATAGWFDVSVPLYLTYALGGGGEHNTSLYGRDVLAEVALQVYIGERLLRDLGPAFSRLRLYAMVNQVLTPNRDPTFGTTDRFNPTALYGLTIPFGGHGSAR